MNTSENIRASALKITESHLIVELEDGSSHEVPISLFPILAEATPDERLHWEFIGSGTGIHWPDLDEDISVFSIVHPDRTWPAKGPAVDRTIGSNRRRRSRRSG